MHTAAEIAKSELNDIRENLKLKQAGWELFKVNKNVRRVISGCPLTIYATAYRF